MNTPLRYLYRVPMLVWHMLVDLPLVLLLMTPLTAHWRIGDETLEQRMVRAWSAGMMRVFGFRPRRQGTPLAGATLFVANHVSWVDIVLLQSQRMMGLVAKQEIETWPLVGWMAARAETIFHRRGSTQSLGGVTQTMLQRLRSGHSVGVFPEGRTRDGRELGPFHARIFTAAVEAGVPIQPVALRYGRAGDAQTVVAFSPGEAFLANLLRLLGEPGRDAEVVFLAPIRIGDAPGRSGLADIARLRIQAAMDGAGNSAG